MSRLFRCVLLFAACLLLVTDKLPSNPTDDRASITRAVLVYRPRVLDPYSGIVTPFARDAVSDAAPPSIGIARRWLLDVARLTLWAWQTAGLELDRPTIFEPDVIARYLSDEGGDWKGQRLRTTAVNLARIGNAINGTTHLPVNVPSSQSLAAPYTENDFPWIFSWAATQRTHERRILAHTILGFCAGAGLTTAEVLALTREDITEDNERILVSTATEPSRTIIVDPLWLSSARTALELAPSSGLLLYPSWGTSRRGMFSTAVARNSRRTPRVHRLRNTWLVGVLQSHPLPLVLHLAGLSSAASLKRLDAFVPAPSGAVLDRYTSGALL